MPAYNRVVLMGYLTRDPEIRYTSKGTAVGKISIAINRSWHDPQTNEKKDEVTFVECDAFGKTAETIGQYCKKGHPIHVEGRLKLDKWEDKQTKQQRSKLGVVLETFQFLTKKGDESAGGTAAKPGHSSVDESYKAASEGYGTGAPPDDDVPF